MVILLSSMGLQDVRAWVPVWEGAVHAHVAATAPDGRALAFCQTDPTMYTDPAAGDHVQQPMGLLRATRQLLAAAGYCVRPPRSSRKIGFQARLWLSVLVVYMNAAAGSAAQLLLLAAGIACVFRIHRTGLRLVCDKQDLHRPLLWPPALVAGSWAAAFRRVTMQRLAHEA